MPSGKRSRELRHVVPVPVGPAPGRARRASPRVLAIAGAAVAAVVLAVVIVVAVTNRSSSTPARSVPEIGSLTGALPGAAEVESLFHGIPQHGTTLGAPTAPATLVEYVDLQCPYCRVAETDVLPSVIRQYVRAGKLRVVLRIWAFIGPDSVRGQAAVLAAAEQNRAFNVLAILYRQQGTENTGWLSDDLVTAAAASIPGLNVPDLLDARKSASVKAAAADVDRLARAEGITSTPTLVVGKTGTAGSRVAMTSADDAQAVVRAIKAALA